MKVVKLETTEVKFVYMSNFKEEDKLLQRQNI